MALFTDGLLVDIEELVGYESSVLETARAEGIELGVKLVLAQGSGSCAEAVPGATGGVRGQFRASSGNRRDEEMARLPDAGVVLPGRLQQSVE